MASLSSTGIGSGIAVETVVSQLVALEKKPLDTLKTKATAVNSQISVYARIKSLMSTFSDAAAKLTQSATWNAKLATSSSSAVSATVTSAAQAASYDIGVSQLARSQSVASSVVAKDSTVGVGTLSIQLGSWSGASSLPASPQFAVGAAPAISVSVSATDTLSDIATKINQSNGGVTASVLRDASGERLLVRSSATGESTGFRIQSSDSSLSSLTFDPQSAAGVGMAANTVQYGQNAQATINGIAITSTTNVFTDALPGVSFTASQTTASPTLLTVSSDADTLKKNVQDFVTAYNAINDLLSTSTKYDESSKTAGALQGDGTTVGLQNALRSLMGTSVSGTFQRLSDIGIDTQKGGKLVIDDAKLATAVKSPTALQALFAGSSGVEGLASKVKSFATLALGSEGMLENKTSALNLKIKRNSEDQDRVNDRATRVEKQLRERYQALDTKMASLTALNAYIGQQVTAWNKSS